MIVATLSLLKMFPQKAKHMTILFFTGPENEGKDVVGFSRLYVYDAAPPFENSPVPLAAERTRRKDPLNSFNKYIYGWNISDNHYWAVSTSNRYSFVLRTDNGFIVCH